MMVRRRKRYLVLSEAKRLGNNVAIHIHALGVIQTEFAVTVYPRWSFAAQCCNRVDFRCPARRKVAGQQRYRIQ